jgi:hypothetical protein
VSSLSRLWISDQNDSRVVLVGTGHYIDENLPDLPAVANNLTALRAALTQGPWGLAPERCTVLLDQEDPHVVLEALVEAATDAGDTLIFYYVGHGLPDALGTDDQLLLALTRSQDSRPWRSLSYAAVRRVLLDPATTARRKVVILDCCFAGLAGGLGDPDGLGNSADVTGTYVLTATSPTSRAISPPGELYTGFTGALLKLHEEGIPGKGAVLDMATIYERLRQTLPARGLPRPQQNNRDLGGKIAFIVNPAHQTTTHSNPAPTQSPKNQPRRRNAPRKASKAPSGEPERKDEGTTPTGSGIVIPDSLHEPSPREEDQAGGAEYTTPSGLVIPDTARERTRDDDPWEEDEDEGTTASGLVIPDTARERPWTRDDS